MQVRVGEAGFQDYFRCDRYVKLNSAWHFTTREQTMEGPFASKQAAADGLTRYIKLNNSPVFNPKQHNTINRLKLLR
jgi:hypothetical protein